MNKTKAVGLLSGGLDSTLAAKLLIEQGIEVLAINFVSPFCKCTPKSAGCASVITAVRQLGNISLKQVSLGNEYLSMVQQPKYGYGRGMNPCIDCRIMKIKKAAEYMRESGASFIFTGEVLGQRPMSQRRQTLKIIDRESGIDGLIVRPLSAALFPPTIAEKTGLVDRQRFLSFVGRSRKPQIALASQKGISDFPCPAGGCLLTDANFAQRLREYLKFVKTPSIADMTLLKFGRHFFMESGNWIVVARDEEEGLRLEKLKKPDTMLLIPKHFSAPVVLLRGSGRKEAIDTMLRYSHKSIPENAMILQQWNSGEILLPKDDWDKKALLPALETA